MDRFLKRKERANDLECETQHVISQKTKTKKLKTYNEEYINSALLNVHLMQLSLNVFHVTKYYQMKV